jgi:hypothetical protein
MGPQDRQSALSAGSPRDSARVRRRITPEAGRGLEKLGHAVEYLTDEFVNDGCRVVEDRARLHAIQLLSSLNRQIYLSCGIEPTLRERVHGLLRRLLLQSSLRN